VSNADVGIHHQIAELVTREHTLREQLQSGALAADAEHEQLYALETALDQCWDLLRQRDALRAAGKNPDDASARPVEQVEGYRG
jgi:hypothetical protein